MSGVTLFFVFLHPSTNLTIEIKNDAVDQDCRDQCSQWGVSEWFGCASHRCCVWHPLNWLCLFVATFTSATSPRGCEDVNNKILLLVSIDERRLSKRLLQQLVLTFSPPQNDTFRLNLTIRRFKESRNKIYGQNGKQEIDWLVITRKGSIYNLESGASNFQHGCFWLTEEYIKAFPSSNRTFGISYRKKDQIVSYVIWVRHNIFPRKYSPTPSGHG